jgi:hypothetical protein
MQDKYQHARRLSFTTLLIFVLSLSVANTAKAQCNTTVKAHSPCNPLARQFSNRPPLDFETELDRKAGPRFILTNVYSSPLTAYVVQFPKSEEKSAHVSGLMIQDALTREGMLSPVPRGLSLIGGVGHIVGGPIPQPSLVAAVWEDGSTYGPADVIEKVLAIRRAVLDAHNEAIKLLESGLAQHWNQYQYGTAANEKLHALKPMGQQSVMAGLVYSTISPNFGSEEVGIDRQQLERRVKSILERIVKERDALESGLCVATRK